jgi:cysteine-rich repeat protein
MNTHSSGRYLAVLAAIITALFASSAGADTVSVHGVLHANGGGAAPDGHYLATFSLYTAKAGGAAFWSEPNQQVEVKGGQFHYAMGSVKVLSPTALASKPQVWLGLKLGLDPELPRTQISATPFALVARSAMGLACTGCVPVSSLKADGDLNLGTHALSAAKLTAQQAVIGSIVASKITGDGSELTNIKMPNGDCPAGQAVIGIAADGKLKCKQVVTETTGSLEKITNGAISNVFNNEFNSTKTPLPILDNNPVGQHDTIVVPSVGTALSLSILLELENSSIKHVVVKLLDPAGNKHVLYNKGSSGTKLLATFPSPVKPVSGDLGAWVGKDPKGTWKLSVYDTLFKNNAQDGKIVRWALAIQTKSNSKIFVKGDLVVGGKVISGKTAFPSDNSKCTADNRTNVRYDDKEGMQICDGTAWVAAIPQPVFFQGTCTTPGSTSYRYFCLNHASHNTAQRYFDVTKTATGSSTDSKTGRITFKIGGYYEVDFTSYNNSHYKRVELKMNGTTIGEVRQYEGSNSHNTVKLQKIVRFNPGDFMNIYMYASHNQNWDGQVVLVGPLRYARQTWLKVRYIGTHWKKTLCGDGIVDIGEACDDGNQKNDDNCSNKCISNITVGVITGVGQGGPPKTMGTIPAAPGKRIKITKVGICGDSTSGSGPNRFDVTGTGVNFSFSAGQNKNGGATHWLTPVPAQGASHGFSYLSVNYIGAVGTAVSMKWTYHYDWDGHRCTGTDEDGKIYNDPNSSIRAWLKYEYIK